jgi:hypothetical protein
MTFLSLLQIPNASNMSGHFVEHELFCLSEHEVLKETSQRRGSKKGKKEAIQRIPK